MENREQQILSEIKSMITSIRSQLEKLDAKMVELHQTVDPEGFKTESINVIIDDIDILPLPVETEIVEIPLGLDIPEVPLTDHVVETIAEEPVESIDDDLPFGEVPEEMPQAISQPEPEPESQPEPESDDLPQETPVEEDDDDLPGVFDIPEAITVAAKAAVSARPTINDTHSADQAWRKDMPGSPVKDIRSAISLNDRVFFINHLFDEDAQEFVNALSNINSMTSLDEVVEFVTAKYPHWNLNSDTVYRFMMAVRRKVN
jgi:hypothetical protein